MNSELRNKMDEVSRAQQELENMMGATEIATLYLDRGRRISNLTHKLGYSEFVEDRERVLRRLTHVEREVQRPGGDWLLIRLRTFHKKEDRIEGVVATFIDIN